MKAIGKNATARPGADAQQAAVVASWLPPPIPSCMSLLRSTKTFLPSLPPHGADALEGCDNDQSGRRDKGRASSCRKGGGRKGGKAGSSMKRNGSSTASRSSPCPPLSSHSSSTSTSSSSSTSTSTPFLMDPARLRALGIDRQMLVDIGLENEETRSNPLYLQMAHQLRRGARKKDPNAPKRPLSAYNLFFRDMKEGLTTAGPTVKKTFEGLGKYVGEEWRKLGEEEKGRYERMAEVERKRYHSEMAVYEGREEDLGEEEVMVNGEGGVEGQRRGLSVVQRGGGVGGKRQRGQSTTKKVMKMRMDPMSSGMEEYHRQHGAGAMGSQAHSPPVSYASTGTGLSASFSTIKSNSSSSSNGSNSSSTSSTNSTTSSSSGSSRSGSRSSLAHSHPPFPSPSSHPPLRGTPHQQIQPLQQLIQQQQSQLEEGQHAGTQRFVAAPHNHSSTSFSSNSSTSISSSSDDILPGGPPNFSFSLPPSPAMPFVLSGTTSRRCRGEGGGGGAPMDVVAHQPIAPLPSSSSLPSASNSVEEKIRRQIAALQTKALLKQQRMQQQQPQQG